MSNRECITAALRCDSRLDLVLADYAERGDPVDLATSIDLCRRMHAALTDEATRIGRIDMLTVSPPPRPAVLKY